MSFLNWPESHRQNPGLSSSQSSKLWLGGRCVRPASLLEGNWGCMAQAPLSPEPPCHTSALVLTTSQRVEKADAAERHRS